MSDDPSPNPEIVIDSNTSLADLCSILQAEEKSTHYYAPFHNARDITAQRIVTVLEKSAPEGHLTDNIMLTPGHFDKYNIELQLSAASELMRRISNGSVLFSAEFKGEDIASILFHWIGMTISYLSVEGGIVPGGDYGTITRFSHIIGSASELLSNLEILSLEALTHVFHAYPRKDVAGEIFARIERSGGKLLPDNIYLEDVRIALEQFRGNIGEDDWHTLSDLFFRVVFQTAD